jgi:hypothetical protein
MIIPAGFTSSLDSMLEQAKDLTLTASSACDLMGTLGATVGGDAIQLAKEAEAAVQAQIPKLMAVAGDMSNLLTGDIELPGLGSVNLESLLGSIDVSTLDPGALDDLTEALSTFEGVASSAVGSITASVGGISSSLDSLKPLLVQSVNITSACGCAGVTDTVAGLPGDITALVPELESILSKAAGEGIPNLEAAASTALNQVKDAATSAGETLMAPGGVKDSILSAANTMITDINSIINPSN